MKTLVAGGTGFLGRLTVSALRDAGHEVVVLSRGRRSLNGLPHVIGDASAGALPDAAFEEVDAVVNLVGVKAPTREQGFRAAHVDATRNLLDAAERHGVARFVHVSVVASRDDPHNEYHHTKWQAEKLVRGSGRQWTILRPGVIWGPGDDMVTHLVKMVRFAPVFPVVGRGTSLMMPVHGADVAGAVIAALDRPAAVGSSYDLVGPDRLPLREVVRRVNDAVGLRTWILSTPIFVHCIAVWFMERLASQPLATRAQLTMLREGLVGDSGPASEDLGFAPRPFTPSALRALEGWIPSLFGFSLRLVDGRVSRAALEPAARHFGVSWLLVAAAVATLVALEQAVDSPWWRLLAWDVALIGGSFTLLRLPWKTLLRPHVRPLLQGVASAAVLYGLGWLTWRFLLATAPELAAQREIMLGWTAGLPTATIAILLPIIVAGEEIFWRGTVALPLVGRIGPWPGILAASLLFAGIHVLVGPPLLWIAALGAGAVWTWMAVKTRSLVAPFVSHLLWDLSVMFWWPYAA
ncbi:MAG: hypothetical protein CMJ83_14005 [Planctomycetes bacterium]|nr:hypothetical protein [Planctomycetota bacterium]